MSLFTINAETSREAELTALEESVRLIRSHIAGMKMPLVDLFALCGEDHRHASAVPVRRPSEGIVRQLPNEIAGTSHS
jgi:hypothetical protein